jgi:hypothetical protein
MPRGDPVRHPSGWTLYFADRRAEVGWHNVVRQSPGNDAKAWEDITSNPRRMNERQHRLKGGLASGRYRGVTLEQWQYDVTGAGRLWYLVDDLEVKIWLVHAGTGHPKLTE